MSRKIIIDGNIVSGGCEKGKSTLLAYRVNKFLKHNTPFKFIGAGDDTFFKKLDKSIVNDSRNEFIRVYDGANSINNHNMDRLQKRVESSYDTPILIALDECEILFAGEELRRSFVETIMRVNDRRHKALCFIFMTVRQMENLAHFLGHDFLYNFSNYTVLANDFREPFFDKHGLNTLQIKNGEVVNISLNCEEFGYELLPKYQFVPGEPNSVCKYSPVPPGLVNRVTTYFSQIKF